METEEAIIPPESYTIGRKETSPFVTVPQVKGHLALLHEFVGLHTRVDLLTRDELEHYNSLPNVIDTPGYTHMQQRWICFVQLAVERFEAWCLSLTQDDVNNFDEDSLPPTDVIMVWHSYMLNPGNYLEDCLRLPMCKYLRPLSPMFSKMLPKFPEILNQPISSSRMNKWAGRCGAWPFDPLTSAKEVQFKTFPCPQAGCSNIITIDYVRLDGTGFLQHGFCPRCPSCHTSFNRNILSLRRLADDLCRVTSDDSQYLAGSLVTLWNTCDRARGERIKTMLKGVISQQRRTQTADIEYILMNATWNLRILSGWIALSFKSEPGVLKMLNHVVGSYKCHKPFSTDLSAAVLRQYDFARKMDSLPWTSSAQTPEDERPLIHAIARYHSFLDLMSSRMGFHVPTLDIDLAWHTHQLSGVQYERDCLEYVGKFVNHDDKVDTLQLSDGFDDTCKAWQHRYGIRYAYCGCPIPNAKSLGQRLSRVLNKPSTPSHLTDYALPINEASSDCTHPSVHSVVAPVSSPFGADSKVIRLGSDLQKRNIAERKEVQKFMDASSTPEIMMARASSVKYSGRHLSYLQEVPMYFETPVGGCHSFSHPRKVSAFLFPTLWIGLALTLLNSPFQLIAIAQSPWEALTARVPPLQLR
ncbi:hypothetical protein DL96DRAFT_1595199 [Flagelloscypha sp. PMI_526]|nr:hypothetical protein DL96DRAFT_1595199 [Flagelloscypha sp. PMI_526]